MVRNYRFGHYFFQLLSHKSNTGFLCGFPFIRHSAKSQDLFERVLKRSNVFLQLYITRYVCLPDSQITAVTKSHKHCSSIVDLSRLTKPHVGSPGFKLTMLPEIIRITYGKETSQSGRVCYHPYLIVCLECSVSIEDAREGVSSEKFVITTRCWYTEPHR